MSLKNLVPSPQTDRTVQTSLLAIYVVLFALGRATDFGLLIIVSLLLVLPWGGYNFFFSLLPSIIGRKSNPMFHKIRIGYLLLALSYFPVAMFMDTYDGEQLLGIFTFVVRDAFFIAAPFGLAFVYWIITMSDRTRKP
jgi:hypothetical protein